MSIRYSNWVILMVLLLQFHCAGKSGPSTAIEQISPTVAGPSLLNQISVQQGQNAADVVLQGTSTLSPNIFKLTDPDRIVIDLTDTKMGEVGPSQEVNANGINRITSNQFDDSTSSLTRVVIGLDQPLDYEVESQGSRLMLHLRVSGAPTQVSETGIPSSPLTQPMSSPEPVFTPEESPLEPLSLSASPPPPPLEEVSPLDESALSQTPMESPALPPALPAPPDVTASEASSSASELLDIQYSSSASGTVVRLLGNGSIEKYEDFVLNNPKRIVVDLPGLTNVYSGGENISLETGEVSQLRLGGSKGNVRIVLDSKSDTAPPYTIIRQGNELVITLAAVQSSPESFSTSMKETPPEEPLSPPSIEMPLSEPSFSETVSPASVLITGVGFKQMKSENKSRLIISTDQPGFGYSTKETGPNSFVVRVDQARLAKPILQRHFDTREFQTAILRMTPKSNSKPKAMDFVIELEQNVPYQVIQEGNQLFVDVDIPSQILRKQTPTLAKTEVVSGSSTPSETYLEESPEEPLVPSPSASSSKKKDGRPKDYRYVKESFMSDTFMSGEPLSQMASILAGEFQGRRFSGRKISLDFKDAEVRSIFRLLAEISRFNIIMSDDVEGRITIRLEDVPWDQAFAILLQTRGLWFEKYGNIIRIAPAEKLRKEKELAAAAEKASTASKPLDILFKPVSFAKAETLTKQVQSVLSDRGMVDIDNRTNTLIVKDVREYLEKARKMVDILDTQTPQVSIEARIVEATTTFTRSFGINWAGTTRFTAATGNPSGVFFPNNVTMPFAMNFPVEAGGFVNTTANLQLGSINNILDLDLALQLGEQEGYSKLISAPKVTVLDNSPATIEAGTKIPFITQTDNSGSNVRFETAMTSLNVTPHITNDGSILMNITATRNQPNFALSVQENPTIDQRLATTEVLVRSGHTTVIGGIYSTQTAKSQSRLPFISRIPIIGALFRNENRAVSRTELLIFVTPRIVGDEREAIREKQD